MKRNQSGPFRKIMTGIGRTLLVLLTVILAVALILLGVIKMICSDISPAAKKVFVTTMLETGQLKSMAKIFLSADEIQKLVDSNSMEEFHDSVDSSMITVDVNKAGEGEKEEKQDTVEIKKVYGNTFSGTMLIVHDPSKVGLATIDQWRDKGDTLDKIVNDNSALGGINAGLYNSTNNSGGRPLGVVVSDGEIKYCEPQLIKGLVLVGLTEDNILQIVDIDGYTKAQTEQLIKDMKIRDATVFQEESGDSNNHFVQLVINGKAREMNGTGSGLNPRTAIGQREDGTLLLLVTDGRGRNGHLGASASDLVDIMVEYGAVNAANLDGGSSSCMYYDGAYLQDSVTFYYTNSSWRMPCALLVYK